MPQYLVTNLDYDPYVGQLAIGRLMNGVLEMRQAYSLCGETAITPGVKFSALYTFVGLKKVPVERVEAGDIVAFSGVENLQIGDTDLRPGESAAAAADPRGRADRVDALFRKQRPDGRPGGQVPHHPPYPGDGWRGRSSGTCRSG